MRTITTMPVYCIPLLWPTSTIHCLHSGCLIFEPLKITKNKHATRMTVSKEYQEDTSVTTGFNIPLDTLCGILEIIFPASHLTGANTWLLLANKI